MTTLAELEADLARIRQAMKDDDDQDEYEYHENEYACTLDALIEACNTQEIKICGILQSPDAPEGMVKWQPRKVHRVQGCVAAELVDEDEWIIHHLPSGCWVGLWNGKRMNLPAFLAQADALLAPVTKPYDEAPEKMRALKKELIKAGLTQDVIARAKVTVSNG